MFVSPAHGRVTSHWGPRERHPVTGVRGFHRGIDIAPPRPGQTGVPVFACYGGTVRATSTHQNRKGNPITGTWNSGSYVLIDGPGGGSEWYGHLATIDVRPGDRVRAGDRLGTMGAVGNVTGIHLHLEMWDGRHQGGGAKGGNTRDPRDDFKAHGVTPGSAPVLPKTPIKNPVTPLERTWPDMSRQEFNEDASRHAENVVAQTTENILTAIPDLLRQSVATQNAALHNAFRREAQAAGEQVAAQIASLPTVTSADAERIRLAILGDVHPKTPGTDLRGVAVTTMQDTKALLALVQSLAGALAATADGEDFDTNKFLSTTTTEED